MRTEAEIQTLRDFFEDSVREGKDVMAGEMLLTGRISIETSAALTGGMMALDCLKWIQGEESDAVGEYLRENIEESGSHQCEVTAPTGEDSTPE